MVWVWVLCGVIPAVVLGTPFPRVQQQYVPSGHPSSVNCTWHWFNQSLDHFAPGATPGHGATFPQRYCVYSSYWTQGTTKGPIFFYTGNESPVEEYVNNTGLMWELAPKVGALLVFAEHRYEGLSVPTTVGLRDCMAYCTTAQALADYAWLLTSLKETMDAHDSPVVAFGGSYGGMLSAWFRMKYPNIVAGSIAASAPIWGFARPQQHINTRLDGAAVAITRGVSAAGGATDMCRDNILSSWVFIRDIGRTAEGRAAISKAFQLCRPLETEEDVTRLIDYGHGPWFDMAEGDFPFPSTYITFAVGPGMYPLPAWPMRVACKALNKDYGVRFVGNREEVDYTVSIGRVGVKVDWTHATGNGYTIQDVEASGVLDVIAGVRAAVGVWYNVTGKLKCYGEDLETTTTPSSHRATAPAGAASDLCTASYKRGCWGPVCCNDNLNLVNTMVHGVGRDLFWPPNVATRNYTLEGLIGPPTHFGPGCGEGGGLYGFPAHGDSWSTWLDTFYGGLDITSHSNIVFSNGLLDPWSSGGVMTNLSDTLVAVPLDLGAHHLDLFFSTPDDPPCAAQARAIEETHIRRWIAPKGNR